MTLKIGAWTQPVGQLGLDHVRQGERLGIESTRCGETLKNR